MTEDETKVQDSIETICSISKLVYECYSSHERLIKELFEISPEGRQFLWTTYQNETGPVKGIRKQVAEILKVRDITIEELKGIVEDAKKNNPKSYSRMYREWYNLLYMFVLYNHRMKLDEAIKTLKNTIIILLGNPDYLKCVYFDFTGERETGSIRFWMAFFNSRHLKQDTAKQLFISIENENVLYSVYNRPKDVHTEKQNISYSEFKADELIAFFKNHLMEIKLDSLKELKSIRLNPGENIYKISMGPDVIDEPAFQYFLSDNLVSVHRETKSMATSDVKQGEIFTRDIKIGDYFYLCRGKKMILLGKIDGDVKNVEYLDWGEEGWVQRPYFRLSETEGDYTDVQKWWTPNFRSTCWQIPHSEITLANEKLFRPFFQTEFISNLDQIAAFDTIGKNTKIMSLNTILYGPPGTGKTYTTIEKAIKIASPDFEFKHIDGSELTRKELKTEYNRLKNSNQIEFMTFHQSMSYEDFIEGIKPVMNESDGKLKYDIEDGIFKRMSKLAQSDYELSKIPNKQVISFEEAFERLQEEWEDNKQLNFPLKTKGHEFTILGFTNASIKYQKSSGGTGHTLSINSLREQYYGKNFNYKGGVGIYYPGILEKLRTYRAANNISLDGERKFKNYVLIIDEINRGNISQIFGELITLIEGDKRFDCEESLTVRLPYSKEDFTVPPNLYIIGTMNTADRSVEALDTALRRRFDFEFIPPADIQIKENFNGIPLRSIFKEINKRIEFLLDGDHQIGHYYLMNLINDDDLRLRFKNKIIPLLKEYFYNDYRKIYLILGKGFVVSSNSLPRFAVKDNEDLERDVYDLIPINNDFDIKAALSQTLA